MKKLILLSLTMLFVSPMAFGQKKKQQRDASTYDSSYSTQAPNTGAGTYVQKLRNKGELKGSPYLSEDFMSSKVGEETYFMRYNAYLDDFEYLDNDIMAVYPAKLNKTEIEIPVLNKKYAFLNYKDGKNFEYGFLVVVNESENLRLYKRERISFIEGIVPKTSYDRAYPDEYKRVRDVFYYRVGDGEINRVPTKRKQFTSLFKEHESEITDFMKKNKTSLTEEKDLFELFSFIGRL